MNIDKLRHVLADPKRTAASEAASNTAAAELERAAAYIASNMADRDDILHAFSEHSVDTLWVRLGALWPVLAASLDPSPSANAEMATSEHARIALALGAAKLERNLVAGVHHLQAAALPHEADIRRLIFNVTTFTRIEDATFFPLQAVLSQLLCNLVSPVGDAGQKTADKHLKLFLSGNREDDVILRLLDSREQRVNIATLHLVNNLTANSDRLLYLLKPEGIKWLAQILGRMDDWLEEEDGRFDMATRILNGLLAAGAQSELFAGLSDPEEAIMPSQVTLLKLLDAHLVRADRPNPDPSPNAFLLPTWYKLAEYATASMNSGKDDGRLGSVLVGLILVTEGLSSIVVAAQARIDGAKRGTPLVSGGDEVMVAEMKAKDTCIIPKLVAVLGATNSFLPRIKPTKDAPEAPLPFANIKRDLVRLLAALAYEDPAMGDAVREAGGVELVLSMCETDDRNPYLREYALLCVRNLMTNNPANQAIIAQLDPVGIVGDNGELLPLPERMKKKKATAGTDSTATGPNVSEVD